MISSIEPDSSPARPARFAGLQNAFGFRNLGSATEVSEGIEIRFQKHESDIFFLVISVLLTV